MWGLEQRSTTSENKLVIVEVYKGLPADKVGLKAGDEIIEIDGVEVSEFTRKCNPIFEW